MTSKPTLCHLRRVHGWVGHYIMKSVIDALFSGSLKPEKFQLLVKNNVRSECYGYAIIVSRGVHVRVYYILKAHFSGGTCNNQRRQTLYKFTNKGFLRTSEADK